MSWRNHDEAFNQDAADAAMDYDDVDYECPRTNREADHEIGWHTPKQPRSRAGRFLADPWEEL